MINPVVAVSEYSLLYLIRITTDLYASHAQIWYSIYRMIRIKQASSQVFFTNKLQGGTWFWTDKMLQKKSLTRSISAFKQAMFSLAASPRTSKASVESNLDCEQVTKTLIKKKKNSNPFPWKSIEAKGNEGLHYQICLFSILKDFDWHGL